MKNKTIKIFAIVAILLSIILGMVNTAKAVDVEGTLRAVKESTSAYESEKEINPVKETPPPDTFVIVIISVLLIISVIIAIVVIVRIIK